ncbi:2-succinyl-6-hydroxy-2,4-cyclohexadiene-1-carboxylate synthase [Entomohabitans teleogrylli]|uniref:2-succinyl-6-hydroxy-2, 4-cyclohexadiene-1-carboxylate synthase n=1 Tax=Entomohabitans teleogrylli TaxID=1384589 RepID=UPI00073D5F08|nr:2-succinyl-6-hydroxy-2,4-cyclohexadiene-1-carboxylate synthase [Entomohabitans teleogrylli]
MILAAQHLPAPGSDRPWLVWLHGFLGSRREWLPVARGDFVRWPQLIIDLPGHGGSAGCTAHSFQQVSEWLHNTLVSYNILNYWLIGYSLGGRLAMYHACHGDSRGLQGMIIEGGNPGLASPALREQRLRADRHWAQRLRGEPVEQVLAAWYQQPVFSSLSDAQRRELVADRRNNDPQALAAMLEATSLGRQPDLTPALRQLAIPVHYLCGERDAKFQAIAATLPVHSHTIMAAGHNAHREQPGAFAHCLNTIFRQYH